jgi:sec-independent protein translocase protein TatA
MIHRIEEVAKVIVHYSAITPVSLLIIGIVALLIFGPKKLPELGRAMGTTLREFRSATKGLTDDDDNDVKKNVIEHKENNDQNASK